MERKHVKANEYIVIGNQVNIRDVEGHLHKLEIFPNIEEVLIQENRLCFLNECMTNEISNIFNNTMVSFNSSHNILLGTFITSLAASICNLNLQRPSQMLAADTIIIYCFVLANRLKRKINMSHLISDVKSSSAKMQLCLVELGNCDKKILELYNDDIDDRSIVRNEYIAVASDSEYEKDFYERLARFSNYGKIEKKLISKNKKGTLDKYFDLIGCSEEDKKIFLELIAGENEFSDMNIKPKQFTKK